MRRGNATRSLLDPRVAVAIDAHILLLRGCAKAQAQRQQHREYSCCGCSTHSSYSISGNAASTRRDSLRIKLFESFSARVARVACTLLSAVTGFSERIA